MSGDHSRPGPKFNSWHEIKRALRRPRVLLKTAAVAGVALTLNIRTDSTLPMAVAMPFMGTILHLEIARDRREREARRLQQEARETDRYLRENPEFAARLEAYEQRVDELAEVSAPVISDLRRAGIVVDYLADLTSDAARLPTAAPILVDWLSRTDDTLLKKSIAAVLSHPAAGADTARAVIAEFRRVDPSSDPELGGVREHLASVIYRTASDAVGEELIALALDRSQGQSRALVVLALGRLRREHRAAAVEALRSLLDDEDLVGVTVPALGKLRAIQAIPRIEALPPHPKSAVRTQTARVLRKLQNLKSR